MKSNSPSNQEDFEIVLCLEEKGLHNSELDLSDTLKIKNKINN